MAITKNITIDQGSDIEIQLQALTGVGGDVIVLDYGVGGFATVNSEIKLMFNAYTSYPFTTEVLAGNDGLFKLKLSAELSSTIEGGRYVYDVEIVDNNGKTTRIYEGICIVKPQVSTENPYVNTQGIKQFAPNTIHKHDNKSALDKVSVFVSQGSHNVVWGEKTIVDASTAQVVLTVPEAPTEGFEFEFVDVDTTFPPFGVLLTGGITTIATITMSGLYRVIWTGAVWKIIKVG